MLRTIGSALFLLIAGTVAQASYQPENAATEIRSPGLTRFALNPQPEPPNIPQDASKTTGPKGKAKAMKAPAKKGDPGK
jgi:hypothetical protein